MSTADAIYQAVKQLPEPLAREVLSNPQPKIPRWSSPVDVKTQFGTASILKGGRVVFNIGGNKYRLVAWINYQRGSLYVRFIGPHRQYD